VVRELRRGMSCADCGGRFHPNAMTWDHLPGEDTLNEVSSLISRHSRRRILERSPNVSLSVQTATLYALRSDFGV
jgi:hypothetical protein